MQASEQLNNSTQLIRNIVIVGGGTAGWLTANHLAKQLNAKHCDEISITLIESPNIPTIGVGEGTVPLIRKSLAELGISESEFIKECDVTFKQGIKFVDWLNNPIAGKPHHYHHIFDYPLINEFDHLTAYWLKGLAGENTSFVDATAFQGKICDFGLAPKDITQAEYQGHNSYAYHLDAAKFAKLLTKHACNNLGVKHILAQVDDVELHLNGDIKALHTDVAGIISADLFVDCSGFDSILLGKALNVKFIDKSDVLFADHAMAMQVPYEDPEQDIPSFTISTAKQAGWIWDIGLTKRRGTGYVYSSAHTTHDEAEQTIRDYIGPAADSLEARKIAMNIGYREKFWHKNCVAIGLSQGFVEPLEATGLLVFDVTAKMLAQQFPSNRGHMDILAKKFNERVSSSWEKVIDFIKLHYVLSKRDDSDFWLENRDITKCSQTLQERLQLWQHQVPSAYDFASGFEIFNLENYLYVLYGMDFNTNIESMDFRFQNTKQATEFFNKIKQHADMLTTKLPKHRELINKIHRFGLQKR
ncbi:tryptophan halogenase family protein [Thalassomonas sp. M1454]|uniref:tryptophan halogenase family protein n=1 Tax=Thalassomonas sp. M1454 TaxID=2594477 RepID=UPI00117DAEBE|nr:tryptophan halogenase family protein [Thalassomonas sp. M1454]TRX55672.1 tryptophan 7-halogenase [Thalassomonas sp. M1454]